jgi:GYF domain 2
MRMPTDWHYARGGSQIGPLSTEEVRRRLAEDGFPPDALVWREGLQNWQIPEDFPEFVRKSKAVPPPLPMSPPTVSPIESQLPEKSNSVWLTAITTREQALKVIKGAAIAFFVISALLIPLGIFIIIIGWGLDFAVARGLESLLTGVVSAALALWLILSNSRVAAVALVILSGLLVVSGIFAIFVIKVGGGGGSVVAVIALFAAAKAVEATFKLRGRFPSELAKE